MYELLFHLCDNMRVQADLVMHLTRDNCEQWSQGVIDERINAGDLQQEYDATDLHRFLTKPDEACSQLYLSFVHYFIFRFTAVLELYLKDSLKELMKLNLDLLMRGFRKKVGDGEDKGKKCMLLRQLRRLICKKEEKWEVTGLPSTLDEHYSDDRYMEYLNAIARHYTKGDKWSKKFKHYCKFLDIDLPEGTAAISKKLDSLFALRNDIGHLNRHLQDPPTIKTKGGLAFNRETELDNEKFRDVIISLIELMNEALAVLDKSESDAYRKWPINRRLKDTSARAAEYEELVSTLV